MSPFLVGISWCDPEEVAAFVRVGLDDDPRCSTGIFIIAKNEAEALSWGETIGNKFMDFLFKDKNYQQKELELFCWIEKDPEQSRWKHCLNFFQTVSVGQFPEFKGMTAEAYSDWCKKAGIS